MGRYSSKKRKGTRKQSFKNRKKVKKGGDNHENKDAAQEEAAPTDTVDNTNQDAAAPTDTVDNTNQDAAATTTTTEAATTEAATTEAGDNTSKDAAEDPQADANVNTTGTEQTDTTDANETNANEAGNEDAGPDWKEGQSEEDIKQAEQEVSKIEGKANDKGELDADEINNLVNQLAQGEDVPLWAKALAKSGAAGTAAKILNANPKLRDALIEKGIKGIKNADVSTMAPGSASVPGAQNTGTGAPGANTGAAAPGGSYTADDAGYQTFVQKVQSDPEVLKNVVYVNNEMSQIFLKKPDGWIEIK